MDEIKQTLKDAGFKGDLDDSEATTKLFSHDASMFEIVPKLVVSPKDSADVQTLISLTSSLKKIHPNFIKKRICQRKWNRA